MKYLFFLFIFGCSNVKYQRTSCSTGISSHNDSTKSKRAYKPVRKKVVIRHIDYPAKK